MTECKKCGNPKKSKFGDLCGRCSALGKTKKLEEYLKKKNQ